MSRFNVIFALSLSFLSPALMVGMNSWFSWGKKQEFKYSNPYFNPELSKTLLLLMQKNNDQDSLALNKDVIKMIAKDNYDLYRSSLLKSSALRSFLSLKCWGEMYNQKRQDIFYGNKIEFCNDFDFIILSDEGRNIFKKAYLATQHLNENGKYVHAYSQDTIDYKRLETDNLPNLLLLESDRLSFENEYEAIVKLPIRLRSQIGDLSTVKVVGEEKISWKDYFDIILGGCYGGMAGMISINELEKRDISMPIWIQLGMIASGGYYGAKYRLFGKEKKEDKTFKVEEKPLVPEKYEEALALQKFVDEKEEQMLKALPAQLKKVRSNNPMNLRNRE